MFKEIEKEKEDWIYIKFDPWYFSNQDNLILQFFNTIFNEMSFSKKLGRKSKNLFKKFIKGVTLNVNYEVVSASFNFDKMLSQEEYQKFTSFKKDLNNIFSELNCKIIISIDNIDRLTNEEINQIFMLVKSLADFSNVIYILSFDEEIVLDSLEALEIKNSTDFIKKIIQVPISVPQITESNLERLLKKHLEPIYNKYMANENKFELNGFNEILYYLKLFIKNIRDLKRYVNILNFYCEGFIDEINIIDLMLILSLQIFQHESYDKIKNNKELLTIEYEDYPNLMEYLKELFDELKESFVGIKEYEINRLLVYMFPIFEEIFGPDLYVKRTKIQKQYRICENKQFDKYFTLSLEEGEVSELYINSIIDLEVDKLSEELLKLKKDNKLNSFFEKLNLKIPNLSLNSSKNIIISLFNIADEFFDNFVNLYNIEVYSIIDNLFNNIKSDEDCFKILDDALNQPQNLFTVIEYIYSIGFGYGEYIEEDMESKKLCITKEQFKILENKTNIKIKEMEKTGKLEDNDYLSIILKYWEEIGNKDEVMNFVKKITADNHGLIKFIDKFKRIYAFSSSESKEYDFDFKKLRRYFVLEELNQRIELILKTEKLNDYEIQICKQYLLKYNQRNSIFLN